CYVLFLLYLIYFFFFFFFFQAEDGIRDRNVTGVQTCALPISYGALVVCYTMNNVPYNALMGVMSASPSERSIIASYRFCFAFLGGLLLQGLTLPLLAALADPRAVYARAAAAWDAGGVPSLLEGAGYRALADIASLL